MAEEIDTVRKILKMEKFWMKLAWLLPEPLVYFCTIRLIANATQGEYGDQNVPELTAMTALKRWEKDNKMLALNNKRYLK